MSFGLNRGMRYGPVRTASATCLGVASQSGGAAAPVAIPPAPVIAWQPAQLEVKSPWPLLSEPSAGFTRGTGGPPSEPTYASSALICPGEYRGVERSGSSPG